MMTNRPKVKCGIKGCEEISTHFKIMIKDAPRPVCSLHFGAAMCISARDFAIATNDFCRAVEELKALALNEVAR
jgi:hypothetical protein